MTSPDRRLSDRIIAAFDMACEVGNVAVADQLYRTLEYVLSDQGGADAVDRRHNVAFIAEAADRLSALKQSVKRDWRKRV